MSAAPPIDMLFRALSDPTRRRVVEHLSREEASFSDLAAEASMALPSFLQHLRVLEESGLIASTKSGRVRTYRLVPRNLARVQTWLTRQRQQWDQRLNQMDAHLLAMKAAKAASERTKPDRT